MFDDRILEHMIQTIENQHLIQKCIAKRWELSQFLLEAGQTEDIFLQIHAMKDSVDGRHIAKVHIPEKQGNFWNHYSSDKEDVAVVCRYCCNDRKHKTIENNAQRTDRNATRVRSWIISLYYMR